MSDSATAAEGEKHDKEFRIIVNGEHKIVETHVVSFEEVVRLAYPNADPNTIYSVSFEKAKEPHEGELVAGQTVEVKEGTEFDVTPTGRS